MLSLGQDIWFYCTSYMSRFIWADINFTIDNRWKYQGLCMCFCINCVHRDMKLNTNLWNSGFKGRYLLWLQNWFLFKSLLPSSDAEVFVNLHAICYSHICNNTLVLALIALNPSKVAQVDRNNLGTIWIVKVRVVLSWF